MRKQIFFDPAPPLSPHIFLGQNEKNQIFPKLAEMARKLVGNYFLIFLTEITFKISENKKIGHMKKSKLFQIGRNGKKNVQKLFSDF